MSIVPKKQKKMNERDKNLWALDIRKTSEAHS